MLTIYERFGQLQEKYEQECENHVSTVSVLHRLKRGDISLDQLTLNGNSWSIEPKQETPVLEHPRPETE